VNADEVHLNPQQSSYCRSPDPPRPTKIIGVSLESATGSYNAISTARLQRRRRGMR